jgi:hypothetical protein
MSTTLNQMLPHGFCLSWDPTLLGLHVVSDALTAISYYTIPVMLLVLMRKRTDLKFSWLFALFGVFIMACGATHIMSIWNLWVPDYFAAGVLKAITAAASVGTAIVMVKLVPVLVALPGPAQWQAVHEDLQRQVDERVHAEAEIKRLNADLESRVADRTNEMVAANEQLRQLHTELEQRVADRTQNLIQAQKDAHTLAGQAANVASQGHAVMQDVVVTMQGISESSRKIEEVIALINSIAFQTNILALNAAVEAARAGEQGRGFAIVANEVRNLARRSADAAKEIKTLIDTSAGCVEEGSGLVHKAGNTMGEIVQAINKVNAIVAEISTVGQIRV